MGLSMINLFCASFKAVPEPIVLDNDDTDDAVHGGQQLALFNAHIDDHCFHHEMRHLRFDSGDKGRIRKVEVEKRYDVK